MAIERYIHELLFTNDCVIVPRLGGFLASNQSAGISQTSLTIFPPYRRIAFNIFLRQNDGLLANHILEFENITYASALEHIEKFVSECLNEMDRGKKVILKDIGTLSYDKEKNIQFEANRAVNHSLDSFGMQPVHFAPLKKTQEPEIQLPVIRKSVSPTRTITIRRSRNAIGILAISAAVVWFAVNLYLIAPKTYQSTSLSPFDSQLFVPKKDAVKKSIPIAVLPETTHAVPSRIETVFVASVTPEKQKPGTELPQPTITSSSLHTHVIAGVFKIRENAEHQVEELKRIGFTSSEIIEANGRHYVTFGSFSSKAEATLLMDSLQTLNQAGWIWNY